ncbi:hypothetical protein BHM03_00008115, partial [Ensete ventricosum]
GSIYYRSFLPLNIASNTVASLRNRLRRPTSSSSAGAAAEEDMKVQCEVCTAEAASVFCCADEAALCDSCDRRVHGANRLAGKHRRFSLLYPSSSAQTPPLCDVCKEKTGFLFCQEDRAILCRDCDLPIHSTSALTMKHSRFLLTGVRLSAAPKLEAEAVTSMHGQCNIKTDSNDSGEGGSMVATTNSSSISEYLMNMLPGWHVDDFLMDDVTAQAFCKVKSQFACLRVPSML